MAATKGCLKLGRKPPCRRSVSFRTGDDADEVHPADDWDRTPVDVAQKLSYEYVRPLWLLRC